VNDQRHVTGSNELSDRQTVACELNVDTQHHSSRGQNVSLSHEATAMDNDRYVSDEYGPGILCRWLLVGYVARKNGKKICETYRGRPVERI